MYMCVYFLGMAQGNDHGTQYRSAIYTYSPEQQELAMRSKHMYQEVQYLETHRNFTLHSVAFIMS